VEKISVGTLSYNCKDELKTLLESCKEFEMVIIIDGKWSDFDDGLDVFSSNDGTVELAKSYPNVILIESPNKKEFENRNLLMRTAGKLGCNVIIDIDSDEYIELPNGYNAFCQSLRRMTQENPHDLGFRVAVEAKRHGGVSFPGRISLNPTFIRFRKKHNEFYFLNQDIRKNTHKLCPNIIIQENREYRTEKRDEVMQIRNYKGIH